MRTITRCAIALALGIVIGVLVPAAAHAATVDFRVASQWSTGYVAQMTVRNDGPAVLATWRVEFDLPPGTSIPNHWQAQGAVVGNHYVFTNESWNGNLAPGASTAFGWYAIGTGMPIGCKVNGAPCSGTSATPDIRPPSTPTDVRQSITSSGMTVTWNPSTDDRSVVRYEVYFFLWQSGTGNLVGTTTEPRLDTGVPPPVALTIGVRAVDAAGNTSPFGLLLPIGAVDTAPPTAPTNLMTHFGEVPGYLGLSWDAARDNYAVAGYRVQVNGAQVVSVGNTSALVPYSVNSGATIFVSAFDAAGNLSPAIGVAIDPPPPSRSPTAAAGG
jgi:hypothetical protein